MRRAAGPATIPSVTGTPHAHDIPDPARLQVREVTVNTARVSLGDDLRQARERLGLTQTALAEKVGVSPESISNWERGRHVPKNRLARLRSILKIDEPRHDYGPSEIDTANIDPRNLETATLLALIDALLAELKRRIFQHPPEGRQARGTIGTAPAKLRPLTDDPGERHTP